MDAAALLVVTPPEGRTPIVITSLNTVDSTTGRRSASAGSAPLNTEGADEAALRVVTVGDRNNISSHKLSIYDRMQRDEIQIEAEKRYAIEEARAEEREKALAEGEARGKAEGEAKGKAEVARAMLAREFTADVIASVTGLTEAQVQSIALSLLRHAGLAPASHQSRDCGSSPQ